jgi:3'-5' exoribonuclease
MVQELAGIIGTIQNDSLRELLRFILATHGEALKQAPAAMRLHHATRGGLLEHILSMIQIVLRITDFARFPNPVHNNYARLDTDLLIAGCILHDIGKIVELDPGIGFDYTTMGRLVGHVSIGVQILNEAIQQVPWEPQVYRKLVHMILSHHGEPEWGAAMRPMFPEAIMLHMIDKMDATLEMIWREMDASAAEWTPYIPAMERALYRGVQE